MLQSACTYVYTAGKPEFVAERTTAMLMRHMHFGRVRPLVDLTDSDDITWQR